MNFSVAQVRDWVNQNSDFGGELFERRNIDGAQFVQNTRADWVKAFEGFLDEKDDKDFFDEVMKMAPKLKAAMAKGSVPAPPPAAVKKPATTFAKKAAPAPAPAPAAPAPPPAPAKSVPAQPKILPIKKAAPAAPAPPPAPTPPPAPKNAKPAPAPAPEPTIVPKKTKPPKPAAPASLTMDEMQKFLEQITAETAGMPEYIPAPAPAITNYNKHLYYKEEPREEPEEEPEPAPYYPPPFTFSSEPESNDYGASSYSSYSSGGSSYSSGGSSGKSSSSEQKKCNNCHGKGQTTCSCGNPSTCKVCRGSKQRECIRCKGSGYQR